MKAYVKRDAYLNRLIVRRNNNMVKVVTGPRRAGKSFLLNPIFKDYLLKQGVPEDHIISIQESSQKQNLTMCFWMRYRKWRILRRWSTD